MFGFRSLLFLVPILMSCMVTQSYAQERLDVPTPATTQTCPGGICDVQQYSAAAHSERSVLIRGPARVARRGFRFVGRTGRFVGRAGRFVGRVAIAPFRCRR